MEVYYKILSVCAILLFIGVTVEYSITVHVANVGTIFLLENTLESQQKKHIDVCNHFIHGNAENRTANFNYFIQKTHVHLQRT